MRSYGFSFYALLKCNSLESHISTLSIFYWQYEVHIFFWYTIIFK